MLTTVYIISQEEIVNVTAGQGNIQHQLKARREEIPPSRVKD
jgi:hypothetical protein